MTVYLVELEYLTEKKNYRGRYFHITEVNLRTALNSVRSSLSGPLGALLLGGVALRDVLALLLLPSDAAVLPQKQLHFFITFRSVTRTSAAAAAMPSSY